MKSMLEELKDVKIKKHTVTSIEYDCKSEEKEDEVFDQVHNIVTNHLDDFAKITFDVEADHKVKVEIKLKTSWTNLKLSFLFLYSFDNYIFDTMKSRKKCRYYNMIIKKNYIKAGWIKVRDCDYGVQKSKRNRTVFTWDGGA